MISEVYGGGGNAGAPTRTTSSSSTTGGPPPSARRPVDSVRSSAAGNLARHHRSAGSIAAGSTTSFRRQRALAADALPTPERDRHDPDGAGAGKVALVSGTTPLSGACPTGVAIIDFVGYGTANFFEGAAPRRARPTRRRPNARRAAAQDTDNNTADFDSGAPDPHAGADQHRRSRRPSPTDGATGVAVASNISITFSEPVNVIGDLVHDQLLERAARTRRRLGRADDLHARPGRPTSPPSEICTVTCSRRTSPTRTHTIRPTRWRRTTSFSFQTVDAAVCGDPCTPIYAIQGSGATRRDHRQRHDARASSSATSRADAAALQGFYIQDSPATATPRRPTASSSSPATREHRRRRRRRARDRLRPRAVQPDDDQRLEQRHGGRCTEHRRLRHRQRRRRPTCRCRSRRRLRRSATRACSSASRSRS